MGSLDAKFSGEIFRKDHPMILASNRQLASLLPVRLAYDSDGYAAGTVLGRNTVSTFYEAYDNGASSGLDTAACILFEAVPAEEFDGTAASSTTMAVGIFGGEVYKDKLVGYDSNAKTDLNAREIIDATGVTTVKF